jgi:hypothetical protein
MSEKNYPERNIVEKLSRLGEALQGSLVENGCFPANFPGKKIADKIDELIAIVQSSGPGKIGDTDDLATIEKETIVGAINEVNAGVAAEAAARQAYDQVQDTKIEALNGHYTPLDSLDFGKHLDETDATDIATMNTYAMTMEGVSNPANIIDGTVIKNDFDGYEYVYNQSAQMWVNWGIGNIVTATNDHLGVVEGTADPGDGSEDGAVTVLLDGHMKTIGLEALKAQVGNIDAALDLINGETV